MTGTDLVQSYQRMPAATSRAALASAGKIIAGSLTGATALISILSFARSYGLVGSGRSTHLTVGDIGVAWVGITPAADTLRSVGDTLRLAATVADHNGASVLGSSLVWSAENPHVASVGSDGSVVARGPGSTTIVAAVGGVVARSRITVRQTVTGVRINGDSTMRVPEGGSVAVTASGIDARGHVVPARRLSWTTADTSIAQVDSLGVATGRRQGQTSLSASLDGVSATVPVRVDPVPGSLALVSGGDQRAAAGGAAGQPVVVRVLSQRGRPIGGAALRARTADARGSVEPQTATTDGNGRARFIWTLGELPGRQRLLVASDGVDSILTVVAEAEPVGANTRIALAGDPPAGRVADLLAHPVTVRLTDSVGHPLTDVPVLWSVADGAKLGTVDPRTDSLGEAHALWTLGTRSGRQRVRVQVGSGRAVPPLTIVAMASPAAAAAASLVSGGGQSGTVGSALKQRVVLRVVDKFGNGTPGARIALLADAGSLSDSAIVTDSSGLARVAWTMPRAPGRQRLIARVEGVERALEVAAASVAAAPANAVFGTTPVEGLTRHTLPGWVRVTITDVYGNPIPNVQVAFKASHRGTAAPARVVTDSDGRARTHWTLGGAAGEHTLAATVPGTDVRGTTVVRATGSAAHAAENSRRKTHKAR
ncbi:MAG: hypothetical protein NVS1B4_18800 [Gemmatimonadaceae bacterium]